MGRGDLRGGARLWISILFILSLADIGYAQMSGAKDIPALLERVGLSPYTTRRGDVWYVSFAGRNKDWVVAIQVVEDYIRFRTPIMELPESPSRDFLDYLLRRNYDIRQAKLGVSGEELYLLIEVPMRIVDAEEFGGNISASALWADENYPDILSASGR
ncbi:MAG: hypothetical protein ACUVXI_08870 [bacterium]